MVGKIMAFVLGCAVSSAATFYLVKSNSDARIAGVEEALAFKASQVNELQSWIEAEIATRQSIEKGLEKLSEIRSEELREEKIRQVISARVAARPASFPGRIENLVITNSAGDVFTNLKLNKVTADGLLLEHKSGLIKTKWNDLPAWCAEQYKEAARAAGLKDAQDAAAVARFNSRISKAQLDDAARKAGVEAQWKKDRGARVASATVGNAWVIKGRIIQRTREGLLVQSVGGHTGVRKTVNTSIVNPNETKAFTVGGMAIYEGLCLLKNHPDEAGFVDGDEVNIQASDSGQYQYQSVSGAGRTIKQFTAY